MRYVKKALQIITDIIIILLIVFFIGRFGWKLFGYHFCTGSMIQSISVEEDLITIEGAYAGSFPCGCVGYVTDQKGDELYIGVRYDAIFGFFERGYFQATIPAKGEVHKIYLKTKDSEYLIWDSEVDSAEKKSDFETNVKDALKGDDRDDGDGEDYISGQSATIKASISKLTVDWVYGDVTIAYHDGDTIELSETCKNELKEEDQMAYKLDGETLKIRTRKASHGEFLENKDLTITLPKNCELTSFNYYGVTTNLTFDSLNAESCYFDVTSGSVEGKTLNATKKVEADLVTADFIMDSAIYAENLEVDGTTFKLLLNDIYVKDLVEVRGVTGDVKLAFMNMGDVSFDGISTNLELTVPKDANFTVTTDLTSCEAKMDCECKVEDGKYIVGDGSYQVDIEAVSGNINIHNF